MLGDYSRDTGLTQLDSFRLGTYAAFENRSDFTYFNDFFDFLAKRKFASYNK